MVAWAMSLFQLAAIFLSLVALALWLNARTFQLPREVAMLLVGLAAAIALVGARRAFPQAASIARIIAAIDRIDFSTTVLGYMLGLLLFAGAMQVDLSAMRKQLTAISLLATAGVAVSILVVGEGLYLAGHAFGVALPLPWALVFGALISPTDPVAVLATVKRGNLSQTLQVVLQGEALFNDGVGIVAFTSLSALAAGSTLATPSHALLAVFVQAVGGLLLGVGASLVVIQAMRAVNDFATEASLTLALAMGVYAGAQALGLSGPIAAVGAGLLIGSGQMRGATSDDTRHLVGNFWTLIDEVLNAVLFLLLGLQILVVPFARGEIGLLLAAIVLVLVARLAVVLPWGVYFRHQERGPGAILLWGGLHGALSLALALSIPPGPHRGVILSLTYAVVAFSIIAQGLTFGPLATYLSGPARGAARGPQKRLARGRKSG
jgi:CPA1 family monovalent cation:H+ antiporter